MSCRVDPANEDLLVGRRAFSNTNGARRDPAYHRSAGHSSDPQHLRGKKPSMKRVTAISSYSEAVDAAEHCFFAEGGIETIAGAHLDIRASRHY
jgi:hypothetical protein